MRLDGRIPSASRSDKRRILTIAGSKKLDGIGQGNALNIGNSGNNNRSHRVCSVRAPTSRHREKATNLWSGPCKSITFCTSMRARPAQILTTGCAESRNRVEI